MISISMSREKFRIIFKARLEQDRQVAAIDDVPRRGERFQPFDEIFEVGNHFRRAASQIDCRDVGLREPIDNPVDRFAGHDFLPLRSGVHMAMNAGEVAELADIDLQDLRSRVTQRKRVLASLRANWFMRGGTSMPHKFRRYHARMNGQRDSPERTTAPNDAAAIGSTIVRSMQERTDSDVSSKPANGTLAAPASMRW